MSLFKTPFSAYSLAFSPYEQDKLAVATSQYFGVTGNGAVHILQLGVPFMREVYRASTQDNVFDVCWHEGNENQLLAASGDGSVKLFDVAYPQPILSLQGHTAEVFSVHSNYQFQQQVASASYDASIKVWDIASGICTHNYAEHSSVAYQAV